MRLNLTDVAIQRLKSDAQTRVMDTQLRGFGILVSKTTKTFIVVYGKERKLVTLGRYPDLSLKEARNQARQHLAAPTKAPRKTYQEALEAFLAHAKGRTKETTSRRYRYYLEALSFGKLSDITRDAIHKELKRFDGKPRAQNACHSILRTFLNYCVQHDLLDRHPIFRARSPNIEKSRERVLSDEELKAIWNAADSPPYGYIVRLLILTGARKMEVRNLVSNGTHITFKDTKNRTDHHLPITPLIREHLMGTYTWNNWQRDKERLDERSGVTAWRLHDLRRTFATNCVRLGVHPETVERLLNHKTGGIKAVYQRWHYMPEMEKALDTHEAFIRTLVAPNL